MKVDVDVKYGSLNLLPENEAEVEFLYQWWIHGAYRSLGVGGVEIRYVSRGTKDGSIGLAIDLIHKTMLKVRPLESEVESNGESEA